MRSSYLGRQNSWVPIEKMWSWDSNKERISISIHQTHSISLNILAWASTVHKVQVLSLEQGVIDFDLWKQKSFGPGQIYTAPSRVKTYDNLYCIGEFEKSTIKVNEDTLLEYEHLKQINLFSTITRNTILDYTITVLVHNVRSLSKHVDDIVSDKRLINNDIIGFTET